MSEPLETVVQQLKERSESLDATLDTIRKRLSDPRARLCAEPVPGLLICDDAPHFSIGRVVLALEAVLDKYAGSNEQLERSTASQLEFNIVEGLKERLLASVREG